MQEIEICFPNGEKKKFPYGVSVLDITNEYEKQNHSIIGVKVNKEIVSMQEKIYKDSTITFLDLFDPYGYRMYQGALKFIFEVAVKDVFKNVEVYFLHSVPKGIMTEIKGIEITKEDLSKIKKEMANIIQNDEKIIKYNILKKDAILYYEKQNQLEKALNIHNNPNEIVSIYKLKNHYNYFYTDMPYHTRNIDKFDLKYLGDNSIVLVYPSSRTNGLVPEYVHYENIVKTFLEGKKWLKIMHSSYLPDLNKEISDGKIKDFIEASELVFNESISNVAKIIQKEKQIKVVLISGPSSTGKTTTMKRLSSYLKAFGYNTIPISIDDYYKEEIERKDEKGNIDYESLDAIDVSLFNENLTDLLSGKEIYLPQYDFTLQKRKFNTIPVQMKDNTLLLIEGLHGLNDELTHQIPKEAKYKIYLSPFIPLGIDRHNYVSTVDLRLLRRIVRDNRDRGTDVSKTIQLWQSVREGEEKYIFPFIHQANIIVNTAYAFEIGVLKVFVEPLLYSVKNDSPYYEEARRLLDSLRNFYPIPSEYVSKDSILREFIG